MVRSSWIIKHSLFERIRLLDGDKILQTGLVAASICVSLANNILNCTAVVSNMAFLTYFSLHFEAINDLSLIGRDLKESFGKGLSPSLTLLK